MTGLTMALHKDFLTAFTSLPSGIQTKTNTFIKKFEQNPKDPGIRLEKIFNPYDDKFYSGRVDITYRVIIAIQEKTNTYIFLWVDHHDEAYDWAKTRRIEVNKLTGLLQLYVINPIDKNEVVRGLFDKYTDNQLLALGVPSLQLPFIRSIKTISDFYENKKAFSEDVYEYLEFLVDGEDYREVLKLVQDLSKETDITEDFDKALNSLENGRSYTVVKEQEELDKMFYAPLEKWRVFLHPSQKKLVDKDFSGPARVSGEAGTGKTVVAMHRAKYLLKKGKKVLFTTFTVNLVGDIETNIMEIIGFQDVKRLDIKSIDSVISSYLKSILGNISIIYDEGVLEKYWNKAIESSKVDLGLKYSFYLEEWRKIATVMDNLSVEKYISVPRIGRKIRLDRGQRLKVWHVFEEYMAIIGKVKEYDIDYATYKARELIKNNPIFPYDSIIVDEGQDISANAYKFLRQLAGAERENDIFIVGDLHQRIYKNKAVLSNCGINIKGRSSLLKINYRTTEETRKYAYSFLNGISFVDVDDNFSGFSKCQSLTHGDKPIVKNFITFEEQMEYVKNEVQKLIDSKVTMKDICIVARVKEIVENANSYLSNNNIMTYIIDKDKKDDGSEEGVRLATMHRVKGLEFRYVFLISINEDILPLKKAIEDSDDYENDITIEKSLLYVSLTRAQKMAYVLSCGKQSSFLDVSGNDDL